jgi:hypothetical protein
MLIRERSSCRRFFHFTTMNWHLNGIIVCLTIVIGSGVLWNSLSSTQIPARGL